MTIPRLEVLLGDEVIGEATRLEFDESMGVLCGPFRPAAAYEEVSSVFRMFTSGNTDEYYAARDALPLGARVEPGGHVLPAPTLHITDARRELDDGTAIQIEVYLSDALPQDVRALLGV